MNRLNKIFFVSFMLILKEQILSLRKSAARYSLLLIHYSFSPTRYSFLLLVSCFFFLTSISNAQQVTVAAKADTNQIKIGEQFGLNLSMTAPSGTKIFFPGIPDTIHKLEVVSRSKIDTIKSADGKLSTLQQKLTLTCFDSGYYVIEPITFYFQQPGKAETDSLTTEAQLLTVKTIPVDTTKAIKDIKSTLDVPLTLMEVLPYIIGALVILLLVGFIIYLTKKNKKSTAVFKRKVPLRPAHEIALEALKQTESEKLWQQGYFKKYHSNVSDTIRTYIEHRFSINAMEFTTDETLKHFWGDLVNDEAKEKLKYILQLADMVKFAKVQPIANENEQLISNAFSFVMLTKPVTQDDFKATAENEKEAAI